MDINTVIPIVFSVVSISVAIFGVVWAVVKHQTEAVLTYQAALHESRGALRKLRKRHLALKVEEKLLKQGKHPAVMLFGAPNRRKEMENATHVRDRLQEDCHG
jgi:hypothetical protein